MSDSATPWTVTYRFLSPWNSAGQNTGVGSLSLLQGLFPTQGLNTGLPHCRQILNQLSHTTVYIPPNARTWTEPCGAEASGDGHIGVNPPGKKLRDHSK